MMIKTLSFLSLSLSFFLLTGCLEKETKTETSTDALISVIEIEHPYSFATMPGARTGAAFMKIKNISSVDDVLISAQAKVSDITEIHENLIDPDDGTMMMRKINTLDIPAGETVDLQPKGYHVMFIKMKEPLTLGNMVPLTLTFEKAGVIETKLEVIQPGASYGAHAGH